MAELVSQAEVARRMNVSPQAINKLVKGGKLPLQDGRVDMETARELLAARLNPAKSKILRGGADGDESPLHIDYAQAKARREHYEGLRAKLEYERRSGDLAEVEKVRRAAYRVGRMTRDAVLNVPARIATALAAESDHWQVQKLLAAALRAALDDIAKLSAGDLDRELDG